MCNVQEKKIRKKKIQEPDYLQINNLQIITVAYQYGLLILPSNVTHVCACRRVCVFVCVIGKAFFEHLKFKKNETQPQVKFVSPMLQTPDQPLSASHAVCKSNSPVVHLPADSVHEFT